MRAQLIAILFFSVHAYAAIHTFGIVGDAGRANRNNEVVRDSLIRTETTRLILAGDQLYDLKTSYADTWQTWLRAGLNMEVVTLGNHHSTYAEEIAFFKMPGEYYAYQPSPQLQFLVLNSDNEDNIQEQMKWLEQQLRQTQSKFVFVLYHHPSLTMHYRHSWRERREFQEHIRPLLNRYREKLTGVIVGHDHVASMMEFGDLPVILTGATQDVRYSLPPTGTQQNIPITNHWFFDFKPYWVRLTVDDTKDSAQVEFVRAKDDHVAYSTRLTPGKRITTAPCASLLQRIARFLRPIRNR